MQANEFQQEAQKTINSKLTFNEKLADFALGLAGESGEVVDVIKKILFQGHELNNLTKAKLLEELGDVGWYFVNLATLLGFSLEEIFDKNIEKLKSRYKTGFNSFDSIHRKE